MGRKRTHTLFEKSKGWSSRCRGCPRWLYGWMGMAGPHQLNSCQNFNLLKQTNSSQLHGHRTTWLWLGSSELYSKWRVTVVNFKVLLDTGSIAANFSHANDTWKFFKRSSAPLHCAEKGYYLQPYGPCKMIQVIKRGVDLLIQSLASPLLPPGKIYKVRNMDILKFSQTRLHNFCSTHPLFNMVQT